MPETEVVPVSNGDASEDLKETGPSKAQEHEDNEVDEEAKKENINGVSDPPSKDTESEEREKANGDGEDDAEEDKEARDEWEFERMARNRVKLYVLCEQRVWDDRGTGHVACLPLPDKSGFHAVVVRLEANEKNVLESKILMDTVYQKQQETLIVWSESDTTDLALSFQEKSGCEELWNEICKVQGKDPKECMLPPAPENDENDDGESSEGASGSGNERGEGGGNSNSASNKNAFVLPPVEISRLNEIEFLLANNCNTGAQKERFANAVESQNYVQKLCDTFRMCEDIEHTKGLRALYNIIKSLFMLNKNSVIEALLHEECLRDVIGMLEYDPLNTEHKPHREFLYERARFREILPMDNEILREKIHQAYRVQYVQDVCLPAPSLFEENNLSVLNSYIFFLRVDIVTLVQENKSLMNELFCELIDPSTVKPRRKELCAFLKELCAMSGTLQQSGPQSKEAFYKSLMQNDVLCAIEPAMQSDDKDIKAIMTEILHMVVEYNSNACREFIIRQSKDKKDEDILLNMLLRHIVSDRDPELSSATQMLQVMRMLLDPEHMAQKGEKNEFLHIFYAKCLPVFTTSLDDVVKGVNRPRKDDYHTAKKLSLVLRLLNFCVGHHSLPMRTFIIRRDFLNKVLVLLSSRHHFLALYALKLLRSVIQQKDEFYYNYVTEKNVFDKVVECLIDNGRRNNLLNSAVIELFEYMRQDDMKPVIAHVVERHIDTLLTHGYVKTFRELKLRYDQNKDREEQMRRAKEEGGSSYNMRKEESKWKNREREMEKEEQWFDNEEDDEEEDAEEKERKEEEGEKKRGEKREERSKAPGPSPGRKSGAEPMFPKMKSAKADDEDSGVFGGGSTTKMGPSLPSMANAPKIIIKVLQTDGTRRSRSPSPGTVPREDEVSSSQASSSAAAAAAAASPSGAAQKRAASDPPGDSPNPKKGLVEYDDSDSDSDHDDSSSSSSGSTERIQRDDSVPSSSTGSPTEGEGGGEKEKEKEGKRGRGDERNKAGKDEDVSSTSGDDERENAAAGDSCSSSSKKSRKRDSTDDADVIGGGKRIRVGDDEDDVITTPRSNPSPPPVDTVAQ